MKYGATFQPAIPGTWQECFYTTLYSKSCSVLGVMHPSVRTILEDAGELHQKQLNTTKMCLKIPCTSISASSAVLAVQGLLRQILHRYCQARDMGRN